MAFKAFDRSRVANRIHHVQDGAEALDFLFSTGTYANRADEPIPRLDLLDLNLPLVDGLDLLRRIKADDRLKLMPVVVKTSSKEERDLVESYQLGVNSYIVKPVVFDKFVQAVEPLGYYWLLMNEVPKGQPPGSR
jgi:two-component system response regulator